MNEFKIFSQRIGLIGITNLFVSLSGIILLPILTKNIPIEDYGIWIQINVSIGLIPALVMLGLPYTMVRFLAATKKKDEIQEGFYSIFFIVLAGSVIASLLLFLLSKPIASSLFNQNLTIARILPLIVFIECLDILLLTFFRTFQQIIRYSFFLLLRTCINIVLIAYFVISGYGIFGALIGLLIAGFTIFLLMISLIISEIGIKIPKFIHIREYLVFGIPTLAGYISDWVINSSDRYIIGILLGTAFVGYYSPGYALGNLINVFMMPLTFLLPAVLSKYYDGNNTDVVKTVLRYSLKYFLLLAIPSVFGLSLLSKPMLSILSTMEIASQGYLITPFIALSALLYGAGTIFMQIIVLEKKTKITGVIWTIAAILNLGLNLIFIPYVGILGAAITTILAFALALILISFYSFKYLKFYIDFRFISKSVFASIVMSLVIIQCNPVGMLNILIVIGVCAAVYTVILLLLRGVKKEEVNFFRDLI